VERLECPTRFHRHHHGKKGRDTDVLCRVAPVRHNPAGPDLALHGTLVQEEEQEAFSELSKCAGLDAPVLILRPPSV
jgi:hypothetical protein